MAFPTLLTPGRTLQSIWPIALVSSPFKISQKLWYSAKPSQKEEQSDQPDDKDNTVTASGRKRPRKALEWLNKDGLRFLNPVPNQFNFVGGNGALPFPANPFFKPIPPLQDRVKDVMYQLHSTNPSEWTPRQLATKFNISIRRVEGILKLKSLEKSMTEKGFVLQRNFTKGMESIMAAAEMPVPEDLSQVKPKSVKPLFRILPEEESFTSEDAQKILSQMGGDGETTIKKKSEYPKTFVEPTIPGRRGFVFTDTSGSPLQFPKYRKNVLKPLAQVKDPNATDSSPVPSS